jgi:hypothetical protein
MLYNIYVKRRKYKMKHLSKSEEIAYIKCAQEINHCLGYGSSRIVFDCGDNKVIKVALTNKGQMQNRHELDVYEAYPDYCGEIFAYGSHILVCDKMVEDIHDYLYEMFDESIYPEDDEEIEDYIKDQEIDAHTADLIREGMAVAQKLNDVIGWTEDNGQIGYFAGGYVAAFDFGYFPRSCEFEDCNSSQHRHTRQVDDMSQYVWNLGQDKVLQYVVDKLTHKARKLVYNRQKEKWAVKFS